MSGVKSVRLRARSAGLKVGAVVCLPAADAEYLVANGSAVPVPEKPVAKKAAAAPEKSEKD